MISTNDDKSLCIGGSRTNRNKTTVSAQEESPLFENASACTCGCWGPKSIKCNWQFKFDNLKAQLKLVPAEEWSGRLACATGEGHKPFLADSYNYLHSDALITSSFLLLFLAPIYWWSDRVNAWLHKADISFGRVSLAVVQVGAR